MYIAWYIKHCIVDILEYMKVHDANVVLEVNHARDYAKEVLETNEKPAT